MFRASWLAIFALTLPGCQNADKSESPSRALEEFVAEEVIGRDSDRWIELKNLAGEWERTGLIFGYVDDSEECLKAIAGLKRVNYAREYRCVSANGNRTS